MSEGAKPGEKEKFVTQSKELDAFGHIRLGDIAKVLAKEIEERTGAETRSVILGHLQALFCVITFKKAVVPDDEWVIASVREVL